jgi:signal transduction histidine kinase
MTLFGAGLSGFVLAAAIFLAVRGAATIRGWQRVALQNQDVLATNRALREQIERQRREVDVRITAEEQQRVPRRALASDIRRQRRNLDEDLRHFASFVSHELRQPLASMQIFLKLLESRIGDPERTREYVAELQGNVVRMASSVDGQLALVRTITSDEDASFDVPIDLDALLLEIAGVVAAPLAEVGGTITIAPLATIDGSPDQLRQVFRNLIENAVKYRHPERPLIITVTSTVTEDGMCEVVVADNGVGFAPKDEATIFTMFRRLDPSRTAGSGVGLALCRRIVERHGGTIRAYGRPGEGATLVVSAPVTSAHPAGVGGLRRHSTGTRNDNGLRVRGAGVTARP